MPDVTDSGPEPFIELRHLGKDYGTSRVLENVSASVARNDFVTLVGRSGCGKTTFLRLMLGIESATSGTLLMGGEPIPREPGPDRGIVFQRYSVFPHLTVRENVALGRELAESRVLGRRFGAGRAAALEEAHHWLDAVGLAGAAERHPHELSGGMQQRLALAQALLTQPRVLLLDEPFGALDPGIRKDMYRLVLDLWEEHQLTVFMVTHDLSEGFYLGTRLWVFDKVRQDPHDPDAYGATITYDLPLSAAGAERRELASEVVHEGASAATGFGTTGSPVAAPAAHRRPAA